MTISPSQSDLIAPAKAGDAKRIRQCAEAAYGGYVKSMGRKPAPMIADFDRQIAQGVVYVATDRSGSLLGFAVFYPAGGSMHLENIAVDPVHQGRGTGRALIAFVEEQARKAGLDSVALYTNEKMTDNLRLYPALGYREVDRREEDGFRRVYFVKSPV